MAPCLRRFTPVLLAQSTCDVWFTEPFSGALHECTATGSTLSCPTFYGGQTGSLQETLDAAEYSHQAKERRT